MFGTGSQVAAVSVHAGLSYYYGYAAALGILPPGENWPKAEAAANKALLLDDRLPDAYNTLAAVKLYYYRDWPAAERYFRRSIELNPSSAEIRHHYATCLVLFGRDEEALAEMQRAIELEPLSLRFSLNRARYLYFFTRRYDHAIDQLHKTLELEENSAAAHEWLGYAYEQMGMQREAVSAWSRALTLSGAGEQASELERTYAAAGFEAAVRAPEKRRLTRLDNRVKRGEHVPAGAYVTAYTRMGDREQAFAWLNKAAEERNRLALEFKVNPLYDPLRDDPRFADQLRRIAPTP